MFKGNIWRNYLVISSDIPFNSGVNILNQPSVSGFFLGVLYFFEFLHKG